MDWIRRIHNDMDRGRKQVIQPHLWNGVPEELFLPEKIGMVADDPE